MYSAIQFLFMNSTIYRVIKQQHKFTKKKFSKYRFS